MPKLLLACIVKDDSEAEQFQRMIDSFRDHVDGLAVAITGTSGKHDKLIEIITDVGGRFIVTAPDTHPDIYHEGKFANFAAARNVSWNLAETMQAETPYDFWLWADSDDMLIDGEQLQDVATTALKNKYDTVHFTYYYQVKLNKQGQVSQVIIEHTRERMIRPNTFVWKSRLHEVLVPKEEDYQPRHTSYDLNPEKGRTCLWLHLPEAEQVTANMTRNKEILELQLEEEGGKDPRTIFYLAKLYVDLAMKEDSTELLIEADKLFDRYLFGEFPSGWEEERGNAWAYKGEIYARLKDRKQAIECFKMAIHENPHYHMPYLQLAQQYYLNKQPHKGDHWLNVATSMDAPTARTTIGTPYSIQLMAVSLKYNRALEQENVEEAIKHLKTRYAMTESKEDAEMLETLGAVKATNEAALGLFQYARWLKDAGHKAQLQHLLKAVPDDLKKERFVQSIANDIMPPKVWPKGSIVYFAGPGFETWGADSRNKGLGGSETAIIELTRRWAKAGRSVTVFADIDEEGTFGGVHYKHWQEINWNDHFDTFIAWRNHQVVDLVKHAKTLVFDAHDMLSNLDFTPERVDKIDKLMVKSQYHAKQVPNVPKKKIHVISNGHD